MLNAALETMPHGFSVWDEDHRLILWNRNYLALYRLPADRIYAGMTLREVCAVTIAAGNHPGQTVADLLPLFEGWLAAQTDSGLPTVHQKILGDRVVTSTYLRAAGIGWVVTHEDVTDERRQMQVLADRDSRLELQNMRLAAAVNTMADGLSMFDRDRRLVICNDRYASLYHLPPELRQPGTPLKTLLEHRVENGIFPAGQRETYVAERLALAQTGEPNEHVVQMNDGRYLRVVHQPTADGGWVATQQDITENIRHLNDLKEREAALQHQKLRLEAAVNNMSQGLCMFDADRRLVICNANYARIYGLPPDLMKPGTTLDDILAFRYEHGIYPAGSKHTYFERRVALVENGVEDSDMVELQDGRTVQVLHHPMPDGGWVSTHQDVTEQRRGDARVRHLARHDILTDLPNRTQFSENMEAADARIRRGEIMALLCIDLDHFKSVNDTLGHALGDAVLKEAGERLRACCRESDRAARLGGDEFAVLIGPLDQELDAAVLARRIVSSMSEPFIIDGRDISIGASIGIAVSPQDGSDAATLFRNADLALYRAKGDGRSNFHFFEPAMDAAIQERRRVEVGLRRALVNRELRLVFQPLVSLIDNRITGFEALLRWYDSELGTVSPELFIPVAEETGLIVPMGEWVLREACAAATAWPDYVRVAVNISPIQFKSRFLVERVKAVLAETSLAPERLELEVTESLFLEDRTDSAVKTLRRLREIGVRISMGDFGTGYSSLSHLRAFPFDKIKIDRTFVRDLAAGDNQSVITALIGLGRSLGISTAAEGIETEAQLDLCREQGCSEVQGFLLSPPLPASAATHLASATGAHGISPARKSAS